MSISMHCCYSRLDLLHFLTDAAFLFSLVLKWLLLLPPHGIWWSSSPSSEADPDATTTAEDRASQRAAAARAVRACLRVSTYGELAAAADEGRGGEPAAATTTTTCAVCLSEVGRRDAVWELGNCRHIFHKRCLDRWLDHDEHLSCPLCRSPLLPRRPSAAPPPPPPPEPSWAVERLLYLFADDDIALAAPAS